MTTVALTESELDRVEAANFGAPNCELEDAIEAILAERMAKAWNEGHETCCDDVCFSNGNPYRTLSNTPVSYPRDDYADTLATEDEVRAEQRRDDGQGPG